MLGKKVVQKRETVIMATLGILTPIYLLLRNFKCYRCTFVNWPEQWYTRVYHYHWIKFAFNSQISNLKRLLEWSLLIALYIFTLTKWINVVSCYYVCSQTTNENIGENCKDKPSYYIFLILEWSCYRLEMHYFWYEWERCI